MGKDARVIDYDQIESWSRWLTEIIREISGPTFITELQNARPEYVEDASDLVIDEIGLAELIDHLNQSLAPYHVRVFHGTRVTAPEKSNILAIGLRSLVLADRKDALTSIFSQHPEWSGKETLLDEALIRFGPDWARNGGGRREDGRVHVCLSRSGLLQGCSHYLQYGAEVDQHIAKTVFSGESALELLTKNRKAALVSFLVPFDAAAVAANPYGFPKDEIPALLGKLVGAWAFRLSHPNFKITTQRDSAALAFVAPIAHDRIEQIEDIEDKDIDWSR